MLDLENKKDLTGSAADLCKAAMLQVENNLVQHSELQVRFEIFLFYYFYGYLLFSFVYVCDINRFIIGLPHYAVNITKVNKL